jgi:hypothetical protein
MKYQLVVLGPLASMRVPDLKSEIEARIGDLGLDPASDFELLDAGQNGQIDWEAIPVGVWFGAQSSADSDASDSDHLAILTQLLTENCAIFPVVDNSQDYQQKVPAKLWPINGHEWDPPRLVTDILRTFRLTRAQRQAFISYKRSESSAVALQLFNALTQYGYRVFLDTVSVEAGTDFQQALWGRMADVDLLVFLDTKHTLSSRWVHEELARAHDLGLGVLQLIWPDQTRTPGTELSDPIQLISQDFSNGSADAADLLKEDVLKKVLTEAERSRIRSLKARHDRVLTDLVEQAHDCQLEAVIHPVEAVTHPVVSIELRRSDQRIAIAIPLVGIPDAVTVQQLEKIFAPTQHTISKIVYDGLGLQPDWADHLDWLNRHHGLQTNQVATLDTWLGGL